MSYALICTKKPEEGIVVKDEISTNTLVLALGHT